MVTWKIDRLLRSGPLCALATFVCPVLLAVFVNQSSNIDNVLGIMLVASGVIFLGSLFGSAVASGFGVLLFAVGSVAAEIPVWLLALVGVGLFATMVIHDLAGTFRRAPTINSLVWKNAASAIAMVTVASLAAFALSYGIASLATWQVIVFPFGVAAVGFAAKLAADSHLSASRQMTTKRSTETGNDSG